LERVQEEAKQAIHPRTVACLPWERIFQ